MGQCKGKLVPLPMLKLSLDACSSYPRLETSPLPRVAHAACARRAGPSGVQTHLRVGPASASDVPTPVSGASRQLMRRCVHHGQSC